MLYMIASIVVGFLALVAWWIVRSDRIDYDGLRAAAQARGWAFDTTNTEKRESAVLHDTHAGWTIEVARRKPMSSKANRTSGGHNVIWSMPTPALGEGELIALKPGKPIPPAVLQLGGSMLMPLLQRALDEMAGGSVGPLDTLTAVHTGDTAFDGRIATIVTAADLADRALTDEVRFAALQVADAGYGVLVTSHGLRVLREGSVRDPDEIDTLAERGMALHHSLIAALR